MQAGPVVTERAQVAAVMRKDGSGTALGKRGITARIMGDLNHLPLPLAGATPPVYTRRSVGA